MVGKENIDIAEELIKGKSIEDSLIALAEKFKNKIVFSTSFGWEDQVISHIIFTKKIPIRVFTLDTGRLFHETYMVWNRTNDMYDQKIEAYYPKAEAVQDLLNKKGPFSFYETVHNRKECCGIRKVEPLQRALKGMDCWITGIRADQSPDRQDMTNLEWDETHKLIKFHPLFDWDLNRVKEFIQKNNVPYNSLHDKGFVSIGCGPCTRAIQEGEDFRAGRWWWEDNSKKECGLHTHQ